MMQIDLSFEELNNHMTKKPLKRNQFIYEFLGQIQNLQKRTNPKHSTPFYQLNITCSNNPTIKKLFAFQPKLTNLQIWNSLQTNAYLGKKYLFSCRNYRGSYYLVDWKERDE